MADSFDFSAHHKDLMRRDAAAVLGWRFNPPIVLERGSGVTVTDVDGNDYLDMTSGMMCLVLGHSHPEIVATIQEQAAKLAHHSSWYANPLMIEFAEEIGRSLPGDLKVVNFAVTGSEANEVAMRMAIGATGKFDIASVVHGLYGGTLAAESATAVGGARKRGLGPLMMPARANCIIPPDLYRAPADNWDEIALKLTEDLIEHATSQEVAAFIVETMMVAGGMIVPTAKWMKGIARLAREWGALFILDEAQLAPGRTGKMWGFQHYDVVPDIVTFAKAMSGGMAICGAVTTREIADRASGKVGIPWSGTYPGDPLQVSVALKTFQIVQRDKLDVRAATLGELLRKKLIALQDKFEFIGDVRGKGMYQLLDIVTDRRSKAPDHAMAERIRYNLAEQGVLCICVKNFLRFCPPLTITEAQIDEVIGRLESALKRAEAGLPREIDYARSSSLAANPGKTRIA